MEHLEELPARLASLKPPQLETVIETVLIEEIDADSIHALSLHHSRSSASDSSSTSDGAAEAVIVTPKPFTRAPETTQAPPVLGPSTTPRASAVAATVAAAATADPQRVRLHLSHEHPAVVAVLSSPAAAPQAAAAAPPPPTTRRLLRNYVLMPLALPLLGAYFLLALVVAMGAAFAVWPSLLLARALYWACPFIPHIWKVKLLAYSASREMCDAETGIIRHASAVSGQLAALHNCLKP